MPFSFTGTLCEHFVCYLILLTLFEYKETDIPSTSITLQKVTSLDWRFNDYFFTSKCLICNLFITENTICIRA